MSPDPGFFGPPPVDPADVHRLSRVGVVDVGSNSVRLVIFDGAARSPAYFFNEKVLCGLGRDLAETGRLNPEGRTRALAALNRFQRIGDSLGITPMLAVATAAMRVAEDGPEFRQEVLEKTGMRLRVIDGAEEARLAAQGVLLGWPEASGHVCDIGGSSMELAEVANGEIGWRDTSPLGPLALARLGSEKAVRHRVEEHLARLREAMPGQPSRLYLVGGSWRAIAKIDMVRRDYPLQVLHEYRLDRDSLPATLDLIDSADPQLLRKQAGISGDRMALLPMAGQVLRGLLKVMEPEELFVSAYGLREGLLYEEMPEALRSADPLIESCRHAETTSARVPGFGPMLYDYVRGLFPDADRERLRLIKAACLLHDVSWRTHPDYRAEVCFDYAARANMGGLSHSERVFLGLALLHRYKNSRAGSRFDALRPLIRDEDVREAEILGRALRFAAMLTLGGDADIGRLDWDPTGRRLVLHLSDHTLPLFGEVAQARFQALAKALEAETAVQPPPGG
ncbi:Ppx/GppA family phosphatase [Mangrovicoccus algicola]|uniref:Ppx/GppA family phosphatase n=1 Tax=Mangrovicoccus algicola TaxID=2771008 RepID=A0A8J6ZED7_9RHOB|nr:Ppx/GppA family phosphatase [Mangrovicoccus algicola]MBE3640145.1 Ppx/GppA family phosphatase [Mangrovicoccus algicola]